MTGTDKRIAGPVFLGIAAANLYTPPASTIVTELTHIHFCNVTALPVLVTLYIGATGGSAAGTEIFKTYTIAANSTYDYFTSTPMASTDFLTGLAGTASAVTVTIDGIQAVI